ncbi:MAG: flagellar basal body P-ring protein FlgI [Leptospiraceae bacterium]|nr:flagellar basal body P-ring protein FlgI [Leptospiraceae bacterium]
MMLSAGTSLPSRIERAPRSFSLRGMLLLMWILILGLPALTIRAEEPGTSSSGEEEGVRLKDLARIQGVRTNQLLGYGIVVGLPGTGDSRSKLASTSIQNLLGNLGQTFSESELQARNIAAVIVTAEIPPFARKGDRINVTVSSIGDAKSLENGVLIQTPLQAGNDLIYAVAQGVISATDRRGRDDDKGKTVGVVLNGAMVERDLQETLFKDREIRIQLRSFDFTTLDRVHKKVQASFPELKASIDGSSVVITVPENEEPVAWIAKVEQLRVEPNYPARVVINERTGTIVMGGDIRVDPVAISRGGIQLQIDASREAYQGVYVAPPAGNEKARETTREFSGAFITEIVEALNEMGASVQDIISILEALRDSGALHAELVVM